MPVASLELQQNIAAQLDALLSEVDNGAEELARARAELGTWRKALLKAAVTGELTAAWRAAHPPSETGAELLARILEERRSRWLEIPKNRAKQYAELSSAHVQDAETYLPKGWCLATLPQLGDFGRGKSKHRPRDDSRLYGGKYPFVQTGLVSSSKGRIIRYEQTYSDFGLSQSKLWPKGTLCITIAANIAKTGVLSFDACFPDSVVGLSCAAGVYPEYVELVLRTLQASLEEGAPATAQRNINLDTLEQLAIPLPPSDEQDAIVAAYEEADAAAETLYSPEFDAAGALLRQSILAAAFRGDLVQ